ncbi:hypothetical protein Tco_0619035, partial [Tanacetum coccineum]
IPVIDDDLAKAFVSQCHVGSAAPDWYVNSGTLRRLSCSYTPPQNARVEQNTGIL